MQDPLESKIMLVEDSDFSRAMIVTMLKKMGLQNITCPETSIEAWEMIAQAQLDDEPFDLIITDLNMPGFDGVDLIARIKEDPMSSKQKIIVVSADADAGVKSICKALGVIAYFTKPPNYESFEEVILAILSNSESIPEVRDLI